MLDSKISKKNFFPHKLLFYYIFITFYVFKIHNPVASLSGETDLDFFKKSII